jgi:hypothetical protein
MQRRKRNVSCCTRSVQRRLGASTGKRTTPVATKTSKPSLATSPIVYIEWVDAVSDGGWEDEVKVDIHPVRTIGYLVAETNDGICLASTVSGEMSNARMHIPKSWIVKRKEVKLETPVSKSKRKKPTKVGQG